MACRLRDGVRGFLFFAFHLATTMALSQSQERPSRYYPRFFEGLPSMVGKSIAITGCSRGLGYVTARALASKGATVYELNRRSERSEDAHQQISAASTGPDPVLVDCDLLDFASVRRAAETIREKTAGNGLDVLCLNAGIMLQPDRSSVDGYDITASTNVLSHFLLARELLPALEKGALERGEARIVSMSSGSGYGPSPFDPRFFERRGGDCGGQGASYERYHQSKLGNLLFTSALHDRLQRSTHQGRTKIKAVACTPGVCGTDMFVHATTVMGRPARRDAVPSAEDGAMAQLKCACDPTVSSGDLWGPAMGRDAGGALVRTPMEPPMILVDEDSKEAFWNVCEEAVGKFDV